MATDKRAAASVLRVRHAGEIAPASKGTVAEFVALAAHIPLRRCRHSSLRVRADYSVRPVANRSVDGGSIGFTEHECIGLIDGFRQRRDRHLPRALLILSRCIVRRFLCCPFRRRRALACCASVPWRGVRSRALAGGSGGAGSLLALLIAGSTMRPSAFRLLRPRGGFLERLAGCVSHLPRPARRFLRPLGVLLCFFQRLSRPL